MAKIEERESEREGERETASQLSRKDDYAGDVVGIFHFPATFLPLHLTRESRGGRSQRERGSRDVSGRNSVGSIIILSLSRSLALLLEKRCMYLKCFSIDK